jgi:integrase
MARGDANAAADRPASISEAVTAYEADLTARGQNPYNARHVRYHLPAHLAAVPLSQVTSKQLRRWRDGGLIKDGMLPATVNRVLKSAHAAFNLAAKLDPRVAANAQAWRVGLESLRGTTTARDAVLTDKQVLAVVAAAYDVSDAFGLYCQTHAETGARSSQLARMVVADLERDRLMVPTSRKGRGRKADRIPVPITPALAARLKAAATGRAASAPLLLRADGKPWQPKITDHRLMFERAARAARLPPGSSIYSLRHSSIARALMRGLAPSIVSRWHDTSPAIIEAHYGRFIKHHYDDLVRQVLFDTTPTPPAAKAAAKADIVPLRRA